MKRLWQSIAKILMFAFALHFHAEFAFATSSPQGLHLQGRIVKSDGQPVEATNVDFTVQILSPGAEACVLFEETHTLNMLASDGMFNIRIGSGSRSGCSER